MMGPMAQMALLHHYYTRNLFILGRPTSRTMACQPHTYGVKKQSLVHVLHKGFVFIPLFVQSERLSR